MKHFRLYFNILNSRLYVIIVCFLAGFATHGHGGSTYAPKKDEYTLSLADLSVTVSRKGGKIISFKRSGKELLTQKDIHPKYYGGTLWISPQADHWPPSAQLENESYEVYLHRDKLLMTSRPDKKTGLVMHKEFCLSKADTSLLLNYTITNTSSDPVQLSPWDVVRMPPGVSFFPAGEDSGVNQFGIDGSYMKDGMVWCTTSSLRPDDGKKLFHTAKNGWLAHYTNDLLVVKYFPDITPGEAPPGQGEVEIYIAPRGAYIELENHGCYGTLMPGDSTVYRQKWILLNVGQADPEQLREVVQRIRQNPAAAGLNDLTRHVNPFKATARHLQSILLESKPDEFCKIVKENIRELNDKELEALLGAQNYPEGDYTKVSNSLNIEWALAYIMNSKTPFGFTTGGHTGEEVVLAVYLSSKFTVQTIHSSSTYRCEKY